MKKITSSATVGILLLGTIILFTNCSKEDEPVVPAFTVSSTTVPLQSGGDGLQFKARCTNNDVKMTEVLITGPAQAQAYTYPLNDQGFSKNQDFDLQDASVAYAKTTGTWTFIFVGKRSSDNESFTVSASLSVSK
jgi:hypothetical protein